MSTAGPNYSGWKADPDNARLDMYYKGTRVGHIAATGLYVAGTAITTNAILDDVLHTFGTDGDIAMVNRSTTLNAATTLTGVVVGTPVTAATPANSLLISNVTANGDIALLANLGGNSIEYMRIDASAGLVVFNEASGDVDFRVESNASANAIALDGGTGVLTLDATVRSGTTGTLGFGTGAAATVASGVLTATKGYMIVDAEGAGTTDTVDSIVGPGTPADGDLLLLVSTATDTITYDDANINLGAATRAVAPGGSLLLRYDGTETQWTEVLFLAAADNT